MVHDNGLKPLLRRQEGRSWYGLCWRKPGRTTALLKQKAIATIRKFIKFIVQVSLCPVPDNTLKIFHKCEKASTTNLN